MPYLSVVVPTHNNQGTVEKCLGAIRQSVAKDYELIVSDCGSSDATVQIAGRYADRIIPVAGKPSRAWARRAGCAAARGEIIVNVDSDVVIRPDTLAQIQEYFSAHREADAVTGILSKKHPDRGFFSQYKNLYMHYVFKNLPPRITFLYGSLYALKKTLADHIYDSGIKLGEDTELGQILVSQGRQIFLVKGLEVAHLKEYGFFSFFKNDFQIPFYWARIFLAYKGWRQVGRFQSGFAHASIRQLISVACAPLIALFIIVSVAQHSLSLFLAGLLVCWSICNLDFLRFFLAEKGILFMLAALFTTLFDQLVMFSGICCGFAAALLRKRMRGRNGSEG